MVSTAIVSAFGFRRVREREREREREKERVMLIQQWEYVGGECVCRRDGTRERE